MTGEPTHLAALVRWYKSVVADAIPTRLHTRDFSEGGTPEWHAAFRAWLMGAPGALDRDGNVKNPYRFWLWRMKGEGRQSRVAADFLYRLACLRYDWLAAVRTITPLTDDGEVVARAFAEDALRRFWRLMQSDPHYHQPRKSEAQHAAEEAA